MKEELIKYLKKELKFNLDLEKLLEKPKNESHGDFSLPCFLIAKELSKNPIETSKELETKLSQNLPQFISQISSMGPFLNFKLNSNQITKQILDSIENNSLFNIQVQNKEKIIIEYPSPNTNKSLHIGHVRNILLGNTLVNILKNVGHKVTTTCINNDRGIAICKAMVGYELYFKDKTPQSENIKPDEFVGNCYVGFEKNSKEDESLNEKAQEMLVKWESGDKNILDLWKKLQDWVFEGYSETFKNLKLKKIDKNYYESQIYSVGSEVINKAFENKVEGFKKDETNAIYYDFKNETYGKKYLLRGDGTAMYVTQDIALAQLKEEEYSPDKSIFIVGKEQSYHFEVLFQILEKLGYGNVESNIHYAYGYVYDKDGKKFSSRKGNALRADGLLELAYEKSLNNIKSKELTKDLDDKELERRSKMIGFSALSFNILNTNPLSDMKFDLDKALDFVGETGPYIQYTYARIQSILRKAQVISKDIDYSLFDEKEVSLIKLLGDYKNVVLEAANKFKPSTISNYLIKVSQAFNEFYQSSNILREEENLKMARLILAQSTAIVIKKGLDLLDIETLEEM